MNQRVKDLGKEALKLTPGERVGLADYILASVGSSDPDVELAWSSEIQSRLQALRNGEYSLEDADNVLAEARTGLKP